MWCLECFREHQGRGILSRKLHNQVFQDWEFPVNCHNKLPHILNREDKAEVADAMTLLESERYPLFIIWGDAVITAVINSEWKKR
jgi:hypothetical protein